MNDKLVKTTQEISKMFDYIAQNMDGNTHLTVEIKAKLWGEKPLELEQKFKMEF